MVQFGLSATVFALPDILGAFIFVCHSLSTHCVVCVCCLFPPPPSLFLLLFTGEYVDRAFAWLAVSEQEHVPSSATSSHGGLQRMLAMQRYLHRRSNQYSDSHRRELYLACFLSTLHPLTYRVRQRSIPAAAFVIMNSMKVRARSIPLTLLLQLVGIICSSWVGKYV